MKHIFLFTAVCFLLKLHACTSKQEQEQKQEQAAAPELQKIHEFHDDNLVEKILASDIVPNLPYTVKQLSDPNTQFSETEWATLKSFSHRFYSHVKVVDGYYVLTEDDHKKLKISKTFFSVLKNNLEELNTFIKKNKEEGINVDVPEFTEEVLNALK